MRGSYRPDLGELPDNESPEETMNTVSFYTKSQLQDEVRHLKAAVIKTLRKQLGFNPKGLIFSEWMVAVSNNGVRVQINWHCDNLNGTESITL